MKKSFIVITIVATVAVVAIVGSVVYHASNRKPKETVQSVEETLISEWNPEEVTPEEESFIEQMKSAYGETEETIPEILDEDEVELYGLPIDVANASIDYVAEMKADGDLERVSLESVEKVGDDVWRVYVNVDEEVWYLEVNDKFEIQGAGQR